MWIIIRKITEAYGLFRTENEALQYGMAEWSDNIFLVVSLKETLEDLGLDFKEV